MKKLMFLLIAFGLFSMAGMKAGQAQIIVNIRPAEPVVIATPPAPGPTHVWVKGHWVWSPGFKRYDWVEGAWMVPPRPHHRWVEGYWRAKRGGWVWVPGHWAR